MHLQAWLHPDLQDIFELQDQMASSVVGAIIPHLDRAEMDRANRKPTASLEAYDYYLRGAAHVARYTKEANDAAFPLFQRAIELDPDFALAHAAAAQWYVQRRVWGWTADRKKEAAEAVGFATQALKLSKDDPMILAYCGWTLVTCGQDVETGAGYLEQAIRLDANFSSALIWAGLAKAFMGGHNTAIEYFRRALRLSPLDMRIHAIQGGLAASYFFLDRYEEALSWANAALLQKPDFPLALRIVTASYAGLKRDTEAWRTWERLKNVYPNERISGLRERLSYSDEDVAKLANAFRAVGVPE